jgi:nucleoside-diphosphate-sugar epimerase
MINKNTSILVTGGSGLVGSYLLRYLVQLGYNNIKALKRPSTDLKLVADIQTKIQWIDADLANFFDLEAALQGVEQLYHCAAMVSYDSRDYATLMKTNVEGTENIVNAALAANVEKMVYVSSIAAIGKDKNQNLIDEKAAWVRSPHLTDYAVSKYLSEQIVWRAWAEGMKIAIVNPAIILGSGDWTQSSTTLFKQVWDGLKFYPLGTTGFVDVRDVVRFMQQLMESDINGERYILAAANLSFRDLFTAIAKNLSKEAPSIKVTPLLRAIAWRVEWLRSRLTGKRVLITKQTATVSAQTYFFNNKKSIQAFDFDYIPLEKTIVEVSEAMKKSASENWKTVVLNVTT